MSENLGQADLIRDNSDDMALASVVRDKLVRCGRSFYYLLANRKNFERHPVVGKITATYKDRYGQTITYVCSCANLSAGGIAVDSPELIAPDTDVYLDSKDLNFSHFGRVRYCYQHGSTFRVGLKFIAEPAYWKAES